MRTRLSAILKREEFTISLVKRASRQALSNSSTRVEGLGRIHLDLFIREAREAREATKGSISVQFSVAEVALKIFSKPSLEASEDLSSNSNSKDRSLNRQALSLI